MVGSAGVELSWLQVGDPAGEIRSTLECRTQYEGRIVDILLNSELSEVDGTPEILEELAVHECCHALLMPLANLAVQRFVGENELAHAEHEVVRRLQALFRKLVK
jgi:hypothetical protein